MTCKAKVANGVVLLPPGVHLPDGTEVELRLPKPAARPSRLGNRLLRFAGVMKGLPPDFAKNHNHYVHGTPKRPTPAKQPDFLARAKAVWGSRPQGKPLSALVAKVR